MIGMKWSDECLNNLPKEIISQDQFCLWRYEDFEQNNSKKKKIPYTLSRFGNLQRGVKQGFRFSFTRLKDLLKKNKSFCPGFYLQGSNLTVIDIDNYDPHNDVIRKIIFNLLRKGCYIEVSPSFQGLHIFYSGSLNWTNGRYKSISSLKGTSCELYGSNDVRFITLTGKVLIEDREKAKIESLPKAEEIREELMQLKEIFFLEFKPKEEVSDLMNYTSLISKIKLCVEEKEIAGSKTMSEQLRSTVVKIKASRHYPDFLSFCKEDQPDKYSSPSEADLAFAGLLAKYLDKEWDIDSKIALIIVAFREFRKQRDKTQNRVEYVVNTASLALSNSNAYFIDIEPKQKNLFKQGSLTIDRGSIFKICNIMQVFHFGKSYVGFTYVNNKTNENSLTVTAQNSLTSTDLRYFMHIVFQHRQFFQGCENTFKENYFEFNVATMLDRLHIKKGGNQYKSFYDSLLKLSKVHLEYHKLIDKDLKKYNQKVGSLLSYERNYKRDLHFNNTREWNKVRVQLGLPILEILEEANYNYSLFNKDSFESFSSTKSQLLYYHFCQNTLPGKGFKVFTTEELLRLWPPSSIRSTLGSRAKELTKMIEAFVNEQKNIKDIIIEAIYDQDRLIKVKVKKKKLKPI